MKKAANATPNKGLTEERLKRHWSQQELAERVGTTAVNVSRWERGLSSPGPHFRYQLGALFNKSPEELGFSTHVRQQNGETSSPQTIQPQASVLSPPAIFRQHWNVPHRRNPFFTGREAVFKHLQELLASGQPCAICGLAGIGKTHTAIEYAHRFGQSYRAVLWARADTRETLLSDFVALANTLGLLETGERELAHAVDSVKQWLYEHADWLLIVDNVEDLALIQEVLPASHAGHVLLTTRTQITGTLALRIELEPMEDEEGALFLLRRAKRIASSAHLGNVAVALGTVAREITQIMDGLPLALDQAGAYLEETGCSLFEYRELYQQRCALLLDRRGGAADNHPQSVRATLSLAFERIERINPSAADLLRLCAFLYPEGIPLRAIATSTADLGRLLHTVAADPYALDSAIAALRCASLVHRHAETQTLNIHRMVQTVIQEAMEPPTRRLWAERAVRFINDACSDPQRTLYWFQWPCEFPYEPVSAALLTGVALVEMWQMTFREATRVLYLTGIHLLERNQKEQALPLLQRAQAIRKQTGDRPFPDPGIALQYHRQVLELLRLKCGVGGV